MNKINIRNCASCWLFIGTARCYVVGCYRPYSLLALRLLALLTLLIGCSFKVAASMKIEAVWDVTPCTLIEFTAFWRNVIFFMPNWTVLLLRRQYFS